jgi:hypothetical protein
MKMILKAGLMASILAMGVTACDSYKDNETPDTFVESNKDLSGVWQLESVTRNSVDISTLMNFSKFRLHLNADGSYTLENRLPFPVAENGVWKVDDPAYPFMITFTENGATQGTDVGIQYPISNGARRLSITHSPGCSDNKYVYLFVKAQ